MNSSSTMRHHYDDAGYAPTWQGCYDQPGPSSHSAGSTPALEADAEYAYSPTTSWSGTLPPAYYATMINNSGYCSSPSVVSTVPTPGLEGGEKHYQPLRQLTIVEESTDAYGSYSPGTAQRWCTRSSQEYESSASATFQPQCVHPHSTALSGALDALCSSSDHHTAAPSRSQYQVQMQQQQQQLPPLAASSHLPYEPYFQSQSQTQPLHPMYPHPQHTAPSFQGQLYQQAHSQPHGALQLQPGPSHCQPRKRVFALVVEEGPTPSHPPKIYVQGVLADSARLPPTVLPPLAPPSPLAQSSYASQYCAPEQQQRIPFYEPQPVRPVPEWVNPAHDLQETFFSSQAQSQAMYEANDEANRFGFVGEHPEGWESDAEMDSEDSEESGEEEEEEEEEDDWEEEYEMEEDDEENDEETGSPAPPPASCSASLDSSSLLFQGVPEAFLQKHEPPNPSLGTSVPPIGLPDDFQTYDRPVLREFDWNETSTAKAWSGNTMGYSDFGTSPQ